MVPLPLEAGALQEVREIGPVVGVLQANLGRHQDKRFAEG